MIEFNQVKRAELLVCFSTAKLTASLFLIWLWARLRRYESESEGINSKSMFHLQISSREVRWAWKRSMNISMNSLIVFAVNKLRIILKTNNKHNEGWITEILDIYNKYWWVWIFGVLSQLIVLLADFVATLRISVKLKLLTFFTMILSNFIEFFSHCDWSSRKMWWI